MLLCAGKISLELPTPFCIFFSRAMKGKDVNGKALTTQDIEVSDFYRNNEANILMFMLKIVVSRWGKKIQSLKGEDLAQSDAF